jgi:hypothetical protein
VNYGNSIALLFILVIVVTFIPMEFSKVNFVIAQGNTLGQEGDGNKASQSQSSSQSTNQNSMCVSGETTALSCNNLSSESIGASVSGQQGPVGPEGPPGPQGIPGADGATDPTGETGPEGPQGEKGDTGAGGPMGLTGAVGPIGAVGPQGPEGPQGETGANGTSGPQGEQGKQGVQGEPGMNGAAGIAGPVGPPGSQGATGPIGLQGPPGNTGATGPQGPVGPQSIAGKIYEKTGPFVTNVGTFTKSTVACDAGDTLVSGGSSLTINSRWDTAPIKVRSDGDTSANHWEASIFPADIQQSVSAQATVFCFNNP